MNPFDELSKVEDLIKGLPARIERDVKIAVYREIAGIFAARADALEKEKESAQ